MVPLGLFPVFAAMVKLILIQMNTGECLGMRPTASNVHSHDVLADKKLFIHSRSRERRNEMCGLGYYRHPNRTHCCILCHKGTYVAQDCVDRDRTTDCQRCPEGSFMDRENSAKKCRGCQSCRSSFGQVMLTSCTATQDTVCGCARNHYRTTDNSEFLCKPCSACHNGTVWKECSTFNDTFCRCHKDFFLHTQNTCSPCSSCTGEACKKDCGVTNPSTSPPNSSVLTPILGSVIVVFAAAFLLLALRWFMKPPVRKKLISRFSIGRPKQTPSPINPQLPQFEVPVTSIPQEPNQKEMLLPTIAVPVPPNAQRLPDCIQGETRIPDSPAVLYAVVDKVPFPQWKEFVRRLGLTDNAICRIQAEEWNMRDAQYKMLAHWKQQLGQHATVERISSVLNEMELSGCSEAIQEVLSRQA